MTITNNSGIYCIKNIINNKLYIGSAKNFRIRFNIHLSQLRKNKHHSCLEDGIIYTNTGDASRYYGIPSSNIWKCLNGQRNSLKGKHFKLI
jgi:hypothetical protein